MPKRLHFQMNPKKQNVESVSSDTGSVNLSMDWCRRALVHISLDKQTKNMSNDLDTFDSSTKEIKTMKRAISILLTTLAVLTFCSCGSEHNYPAALALKSAAIRSELGYTEEKIASQQSDSVALDRKIIKKGEIEFETADLDKTKSLIVQTVQLLAGYIANDEVAERSYRLEHRLLIRVPADNFDSLLAGISEGVEKFDRKHIEVLDVTEEFIDVQSRIKTKKELQARYLELLKQATKVDEMLNIEKEMGNLQTEIESAEGRMRYLQDKIAFSTLAVTCYQKLEEPETTKFAFASELKKGIKNGWEIFLMFLVCLSYLWVFILLGIGTVAAICFFVRRKRK